MIKIDVKVKCDKYLGIEGEVINLLELSVCMVRLKRVV
jgi:hypothetical protein